MIYWFFLVVFIYRNTLDQEALKIKMKKQIKKNLRLPSGFAKMSV